MKIQVTICKPSKRNKPKSTIKCSGFAADVRYGTMTERKDKVERELNDAVDAQLMEMSND